MTTPRNLFFFFLTTILASGLTQATPDADTLERDVKEPRSTQQPNSDTPLIRATDSKRYWANLNSPAKRGGRFTTHLIRSRSRDYLQLNYSRPVGRPGLRLGARELLL